MSRHLDATALEFMVKSAKRFRNQKEVRLGKGSMASSSFGSMGECGHDGGCGSAVGVKSCSSGAFSSGT